MIVHYTVHSAVEESVEHFPDLINLKEEEEKTPLHLAIANNHFLLASYLMEKVHSIKPDIQFVVHIVPALIASSSEDNNIFNILKVYRQLLDLDFELCYW